MPATEPSAPIADRGRSGAAVVVATRGIDESFAAVRWASAIADASDSPLVVVAACTTNDGEPAIGEAGVRELVDRLRHRLRDAGLQPDDVRCEPGPAVSVLLDASSSASAVVIGSHLAKEGHRLGHGHLAHELVRRLGCPLVVVPRGRVERPSRLVVGLAGSGDDRAALAWAGRFSTAFSCPVTAVHVADPLSRMFGIGTADPAERDARRAAGDDDIELVVRVGEHVVAELVDVAATRSAGLIVVGTQQTPGVFGPVVGEVTARLLDQDDVAVAVVPRAADR